MTPSRGDARMKVYNFFVAEFTRIVDKPSAGKVEGCKWCWYIEGHCF